MIIAAFDFEATGTDLVNDRIIEVGLALYSTGRERVLEQTSFLVQSDGVPVKPEITKITGITQDACDRSGYTQEDVVSVCKEFFDEAEVVMGHNITWFDSPFLRNTSRRTGIPFTEKLGIDTMTDIPGVKGQKLITMCAEAKDPTTGRDVSFVYTKHSALDDAKAVIRLTSWHNYDSIVERARSPLVLLNSCQPNKKESNKVAKTHGFRWNPDYKFWWRIAKEVDIPQLVSEFPYQIVLGDKSIPLDYLKNS